MLDVFGQRQLGRFQIENRLLGELFGFEPTREGRWELAQQVLLRLESAAEILRRPLKHCDRRAKGDCLGTLSSILVAALLATSGMSLDKP